MQEKLDYATISSLPILDSFIKESVRLNPLDLSKWTSASAPRLSGLISRDNVSLTVTIRRKALKPFQFSNVGPAIETRQITCVPAYDTMHSEAKYPHPNEFDGLSFLKDPSVVPGGNAKTGRGGEMRGTTLREGSKDSPIWGFGSKIW